jgi:hypothetical protein
MISEGGKAEQMVKNQFDHTEVRGVEKGFFRVLSYKKVMITEWEIYGKSPSSQPSPKGRRRKTSPNPGEKEKTRLFPLPLGEG